MSFSPAVSPCKAALLICLIPIASRRKTIVSFSLFLLLFAPVSKAQSWHESFNKELLGQVISLERERVLANAKAYWNEEAHSVSDSTCERSAGGINDFYSEGDYWWPDPADPQGPYIRRDGLTNPENFSAHRIAMIRMARITGTMASAYLLTGEERYAEKAMEHLRVWFIDESTRMNPNLLYAQAIKGRFTGRGIGIIDAIHLVEPALAIKAMENSTAISEYELQLLKSWFSEFLEWMYTHEYGMSEMIHPNNHGTYWAVQSAAFAYLTGNTDMLSFLAYRYAKILLPSQMAENGSFPLELERTKPYQYSIFNIDGMSVLVHILSLAGTDLYDFQTEDGRSLKKGIDFFFPYTRDKEEWIYAKDVLYFEEYPVRQAFLLTAALAYDQIESLDVWAKLESDSDHPEVLRTTILKNPLIWLSSNNLNQPFEKMSTRYTAGEGITMNIPHGLLSDQGSIAFEVKFLENLRNYPSRLLESSFLKLSIRQKSITVLVNTYVQKKRECRERIDADLFDPNEWNHFIVTWDGPEEKLKLYLNGNPWTSISMDLSDISDFSGTFTFGNEHTDVRNIEILGGAANDEIARKLFNSVQASEIRKQSR